MSFTAFGVVFVVLVVATAAIALYRKFVSLREDDMIHIGAGEERLIPQQVAVARKLAFLDRFGEILTVITAVYGLIVGALYLYQRFQAY
jgi:hypothetical protein